MEIPGKPPAYNLLIDMLHKDDGDAAAKSKPDKPNKRIDRVALSETASEIREMVYKANALPEVREDKVAELKRRIESGAYRIMQERIASNLIEDTLENNVILDQIDQSDE